MNHRTNLGKLIISKNNNKYITYHKLKIILVNGNDNELNIRHNIHKLIINGNNNNIEINQTAKINQIIIKGNINKILSKYSLNISDYGKGNQIIIHKNEINIKEQDDEDNSLEIQPQRYVLNWENEIVDEENDEEEKEDESDINSGENNNNYFQLLEAINNINILIQNANIFINTTKEILQNNFNSKIENILSNLINISFTNKNINNNHNNNSNEKCAICYENFFEGEKIKMTSCFHLYHFLCIKKWIQIKIESPDCPICRRKI